MFFFFNDTATTEIYPLSLHAALPIFELQTLVAGEVDRPDRDRRHWGVLVPEPGNERVEANRVRHRSGQVRGQRSEEHTSELQSPCNLVCRLLLEKKKIASTTYAYSIH